MRLAHTGVCSLEDFPTLSRQEQVLLLTYVVEYDRLDQASPEHVPTE